MNVSSECLPSASPFRLEVGAVIRFPCHVLEVVAIDFKRPEEHWDADALVVRRDGVEYAPGTMLNTPVGRFIIAASRPESAGLVLV